jgi:hypothetical protein
LELALPTPDAGVFVVLRDSRCSSFCLE